MEMKEYLKRHWFEYVFSLALILVVSVVVTMKFGYVYSTNDDVMLRNIISGNFSQNTDSHLIFISYLLASFWKFLYDNFKGVAWYDLFTVVLHYLSWFLIVVRMGQQVKVKKTKTVLMTGVFALLVVVDLKYLIAPQFTVISALMAGVSVLWMATRKVYEDFECYLDYFVIYGMLLLSASFRREPFLLSLPVLAIVIVLDLWKRVKNKKELKDSLLKTVVSLGVFGLVYLVMCIVDLSAYSSDEWKEFLRSQDARPQIYDYSGVPSLYDYEEEYNALSIDYADWMAIYTYNCELADDFNADKMEGVARISLENRENWRKVSKASDIFKKDFYAFCTNLFENEIQPIGILVIIFYVCAFFVCYKMNDKKTCMAILSILFFYMAVFLYLIDKGRMPERVLYGIYFMQMICLLAFVSNDADSFSVNFKSQGFWPRVTAFMSAIIIGCSFFYTWQIVKDERNRLVQNANDWEYINHYFAATPENRYCLDTASFVFSTEILFSEKVESDNMIRLGDWTINSPLQRQRMESQGVYNLVQQLVEEDNFYIVQEPHMGTLWINSICTEKGYDVEAVIVDQIETPGGRILDVIQMQ